MSNVGWIVLEYKASGRPEVFDDEVHDRRVDAENIAEEAQDYAHAIGRAERYVVAGVDVEEKNA